jgi:hypothetical protein
MSYIEWLRVRNCLRTTAIILGILVLLAIVLRVSVARYMSPETWVSHFSMDPGATKSQVTLPDGTKRTIIDDPEEKTHVVIDDRGSAGRHIVITEPSKHAKSEHSHVNVGSIQVVESRNGSMTTTTIDTNGSVPMIYYMAIADLVALVVATILAAPLAREVDGHLEITLTKPCSRTRYALEAIGADVAGILGASFMTIVAFYLCQLLFETPRLDFSGINTQAILMGIACPLAWYAMLCAATTAFSRSYIGALLGVPAVFLVVGLLTLVQPSNTIALFIHDIAWVLSRLDPLSYVSLGVPNDQGTVDYSGTNFNLRLGMEWLFFIAYGAIALWRWQRVEA